MSEFFCQHCSDRSDEVESLSLGAIGIHQCFVCGINVDPRKENYSFFHDGARANLEAKDISRLNNLNKRYQ